MNPNRAYEWLQKASLQEVVDQVIWEQVMEGTAHCGWTDRAREGLVKSVQESVRWAIAQKLPQPEKGDE
jgi:hypothetical protein